MRGSGNCGRDRSAPAGVAELVLPVVAFVRPLEVLVVDDRRRRDLHDRAQRGDEVGRVEIVASDLAFFANVAERQRRRRVGITTAPAPALAGSREGAAPNAIEERAVDRDGASTLANLGSLVG